MALRLLVWKTAVFLHLRGRSSRNNGNLLAFERHVGDWNRRVSDCKCLGLLFATHGRPWRDRHGRRNRVSDRVFNPVELNVDTDRPRFLAIR